MLDMNVLGSPAAPGILSTANAMASAEAAGVCFEISGHSPGAHMPVSGDLSTGHDVVWILSSPAAFSAWADHPKAVEEGATGIAMLLILEETGRVTVERSSKGTGFDHWLSTPTDAEDGLARMETSGILRGTEKAIRDRVRQKLKQTERSDGTKLPAFAIVVEFSRPEARFRKRLP